MTAISSYDLKEMGSIKLVNLCSGNQQDNDLLWTEFLRRFTPRIKNFIRATLRQYKNTTSNGSDSPAFVDSNHESDLFQNIIVRLVQNNCAALKRFSGTTESEFQVYLAVIARTTVRDSVRYQSAKRRFHRTASTTVRYGDFIKEQEFVREPSVDDAVERRILAREVEQLTCRAIQENSGEPDRDMLIFQLYFHEDLSAAQIALCKEIGLSKTGVEKIISRLKDKIRITAGEARS
jgi:RNA polymerase sigma factor (sigma-70 family)